MPMKNTKAIFLIILGSFIIATGFAFAVESPTYNALAATGDPWGNKESPVAQAGSAAGTSAPNPPQVGAPASATQTPSTTAGNQAPATTNAPAAKPEEKKPFGQVAKEFIGKHMATMVMVGVGAYLGFALAGTLLGAMTGGLFFFAMLWLANL